MSTINLNHLEAFCVLSENLSFSKTAKELATSQPAISLKIKTLEENLGYELFIRDKKNIALTDKGRELKDKVYDSFLNLRAINETKKEEHLKIGSLYEAGEAFLIPILSKWIKLKKISGFDLILRSNEELIQLLLDGELDFIFIYRIPIHKTLEVSSVAKDRAVLVGSSTLKLVDLEKNTTVPVVRYRKDDNFTTEFFKKNLSKHILNKCVNLASTNSHRAMIELVKEHNGVAVIPESSFERISDKGVKILLKGKLGHELFLCARRNFLISKKNEAFFSELKKAF